MPRDPAFDRDRLAALARRLDADVAFGVIPGAALLIGGRDGDLFAHQAGFRDVTTRDTLQPDAIWRIYSMTKPIVSMAGLVLMERGLIRLDQPVAEFIPAFAELEVALPDGTRVPAEQAPTIQDLMRHTAGITYGFLGDSPAQRAAIADGFLMQDLTNTEYVARLAKLPLEQRPPSFRPWPRATRE